MSEQEKQDDDALLALLAFWENNTPPVYHGILTGDGWEWDAAQQTYVSDTGTALRQDDLRSLAISFINSGEVRLETLAAQVVTGDIDADEWKSRMRDSLDDEYLLLAALAAGGLDQLTDDDLAAVAGTPSTDKRVGTGALDAETRLENFAKQIDAGELSEEQILYRSGQYSHAGYSIYEGVRRNSHVRAVGEPEVTATPEGQTVVSTPPRSTHERSVLDPFAALRGG